MLNHHPGLTQHPIVKNMQNNAFLHMELKHQKNTFVNSKMYLKSDQAIHVKSSKTFNLLHLSLSNLVFLCFFPPAKRLALFSISYFKTTSQNLSHLRHRLMFQGCSIFNFFLCVKNYVTYRKKKY